MLYPDDGSPKNVWNSIKDGNTQHLRIRFVGQNVTLTEDDIESSGIVITDIVNDNVDLVFGGAVSKQITIPIINSSKLNGLVWTGAFTVELGIDLSFYPYTRMWTSMGTFYGQRPNNVTTVEVIQFTAYDGMSKFDIVADSFISSLTYPITLTQLFRKICEFVGFSWDINDALSNIMSRSFYELPLGMSNATLRDIIKWIAEASGCYAKLHDSTVKLIWFNPVPSAYDYILTENDEFDVQTGDINDGMTWDEADTFTWDDIGTLSWEDIEGFEAFDIDQLTVIQNGTRINYPFNTNGNTYTIVENPFLTVSSDADITAYIKPIYDRMKAMGGYLPINVECVGNWCIEAGDIIDVVVKGETITVPIFAKTMQFNGSAVDVYEATGNKIYPPYSTQEEKELVNTLSSIGDRFYSSKNDIIISDDGIEVTNDKYIKIYDGGKFIIDTTNMKVDSNGNVIMKFSNGDASTYGKWTYDDYGIHREKDLGDGTSYYFVVGNDLNHPIPDNGKIGVVIDTYGDYYMDNGTKRWNTKFVMHGFGNNSGSVGFAKFTVGFNSQEKFVDLQAEKPDDILYNLTAGLRLYGTQLLPDTYGDATHTIGKSGNSWAEAYIDDITYVHLYQSSSRLVKRDISDIKDVGERLDMLKPVTFSYKADKTDEKHNGLIYEDTIDIMPEICTQDGEQKAINYIELVPVLLKEIQSLRSRVLELEQR